MKIYKILINIIHIITKKVKLNKYKEKKSLNVKFTANNCTFIIKKR